MRSWLAASVAFVLVVAVVSWDSAWAKKAAPKRKASPCETTMRDSAIAAPEANEYCAHTARQSLCQNVVAARGITGEAIVLRCEAKQEFLTKNVAAAATCERLLFDKVMIQLPKQCPTNQGVGMPAVECGPDDVTLTPITHQQAQFACMEIALGYQPSNVSLSSVGDLSRTQVEHCKSVLKGTLTEAQANPYCTRERFSYVYPEAFLECIQEKVRSSRRGKIKPEVAAKTCIPSRS